MTKINHGLIVKGIGGFYYVESAGEIYECRARGVLRKRGITPVVGDYCSITTAPEGLAMVEEIEPRKNCLVRPPVANLDKLFIVVSSCKPAPSLLVIDRLIASAEHNGIEPLIVFTKTDLADVSEMESLYKSSGFRTVCVDYKTGGGIDELRSELCGCVSAFAGNSGVGKSTLLNAVDKAMQRQTGEVSEKLGRGRHTTRSVELLELSFGGRLADTPGFSSFDGDLGTNIETDELPGCFREFESSIGKCKFTSCAHLCEKGCAVIDAVERGEIAKSRHESYCVMYEEAKQRKKY